jgi:hypothetical protein
MLYKNINDYQSYSVAAMVKKNIIVYYYQFIDIYKSYFRLRSIPNRHITNLVLY